MIASHQANPHEVQSSHQIGNGFLLQQTDPSSGALLSPRVKRSIYSFVRHPSCFPTVNEYSYNFFFKDFDYDIISSHFYEIGVFIS